MKKFLLNAGLIVASLLVTVICAELVLRLTSYAKLLPFSGVPKYYYEADKDAGYDISPNVASSTMRFVDGAFPIWSNSLGCFDTPYNGEQPYIFLSGDSFAWGFSPFADKWGTELQTLLGARIVKCGVPGYGTKQELAKTTKTLATLPKPTMIIVSYFANDPNDDAAFPNSLVYQGQLIKNLSNDPTLTYDQLQQKLPQYAQWAQEYCMWNMPVHPALQAVKCYLRNHSILYLLAQSAIKDIAPKQLLQDVGIVNQEPASVPTTDASFAAHLANIAGLKNLAQKEGSKLLFVFIPPKEDTYATTTSTTYAAEEAFMQKQGITYFDPLSQFRAAAAATSSPLYWQDDLHFNPEGNHLFGLLVAQYMFEQKHNTTGLDKVNNQLHAEFGI